MSTMINSSVAVAECHPCTSFKPEHIFHSGTHNYRSAWKRKICSNKKSTAVESGQSWIPQHCGFKLPSFNLIHLHQNMPGITSCLHFAHIQCCPCPNPSFLRPMSRWKRQHSIILQHMSWDSTYVLILALVHRIDNWAITKLNMHASRCEQVFPSQSAVLLI